MTEEAFLRGIIPAVTATGHGLTEVRILHDLPELFSGVVAVLVTMDECFIIKGGAVFFNQDVDGLQDKVKFQ